MAWLWIWLGVVVLALIVEFLSAEMISVWFAAGGLIALIMSACGVPEWINIIVFAVISLILILSFRKLALKYLLKKDNTKTNSDALVGSTFTLLSPIKKNQMGTIKINGVIWNAKAKNDNTEIEQNADVVIVEVSGSKVIVEPKENTSEEKQEKTQKSSKKEGK